jgi:hypothetical protein
MAEKIIGDSKFVSLDDRALIKKALPKWAKIYNENKKKSKVGRKKDKTRYIPLKDRKLLKILINKDLKELIVMSTKGKWRHTEIVENCILSCIITTNELDEKGKWTGNYIHTLTSAGFNVAKVINKKPALTNSFLSTERKKSIEEIEDARQKKLRKEKRRLERLELAKQIEEALTENPQTEFDELEKLKQEINSKIV